MFRGSYITVFALMAATKAADYLSCLVVLNDPLKAGTVLYAVCYTTDWPSEILLSLSVGTLINGTILGCVIWVGWRLVSAVLPSNRKAKPDA